MAEQLPIGVWKQVAGDENWEVKLNSGFDDLNTRLTKSDAFTPNAAVTGDYVGQLWWLKPAIIDEGGPAEEHPPGQLYVCTDPAGKIWESVPQMIENAAEPMTIIEPLTLTGLLTSNLGLTVNGGPITLQASQQLILNGLSELIVPAGQAFLKDDHEVTEEAPEVSLNPFAHSARHADITSAIALEYDYIPFTIQGITQKNPSELTLGTAGVARANAIDMTGNDPLTLDTTGRRFDSRALIYMRGQLKNDTAAHGSCSVYATSSDPAVSPETGEMPGTQADLVFEGSAGSTHREVVSSLSYVHSLAPDETHSWWFVGGSTDDKPFTHMTMILIDLGVDIS